MPHLPKRSKPCNERPFGDPGWQRLVDVVTGGPSDDVTRFRFRLDSPSDPSVPGCLHLEIEASGGLLWSPFTDRNAALYEADVLEVFFDPLGGGRLYRELEVAPTGAHFDAWILNRTDLERSDAVRELHTIFPRQCADSPRVEVRIDGRRPGSDDIAALREGMRATQWSAHWKIPLEPTGAPRAETSATWPDTVPLRSPVEDWRVNVFRIQHRGPGTPANLQAWRPTGRRDFHRPEVFARLPLS